MDDEIMIFDGVGNSYKAKITKISKGYIEGRIISSSYEIPKFKVNLYTAIPKGDRFEWLIEKAGELGISEIIPLNTKRSVNKSFYPNKLERYKKISIAASSQCGRKDIMKINGPVGFENACLKTAENKDYINILPWESENSNILSKISKQQNNRKGSNIFIGPEGGFEDKEVEFAQKLGIKTITLGRNILRVETAAITASILIFNYFGVYEAK
jgi:16S rRNA (uracil1498-N3)-methyltransferase